MKAVTSAAAESSHTSARYTQKSSSRRRPGPTYQLIEWWESGSRPSPGRRSCYAYRRGTVSARLIVPDFFRHRQVGEIAIAQRPVGGNPRHPEQHHPLPRVLSDMPGRALHHLVQFLRPVIRLGRLLCRSVRRVLPPPCHLGPHPPPVIGESGRARHVFL